MSRRVVSAAKIIISVILVCVFVYSFSREAESQLSTDAATLMVTTSNVNHTRPRQECQAMFTIDKGDPSVIWYSDKHYAELSHQLPPLLRDFQYATDQENNFTTMKITLEPRLNVMDGAVPYIPCRVRQYKVKDVAQCVALRAAQGGRTWVALVGDSKQRQKTHSFLTFLPPHLAYTFFIGDEEVNRQKFTDAVMYHSHFPPTYDIVGRLVPAASSARRASRIPSDVNKESDEYHNDTIGTESLYNALNNSNRNNSHNVSSGYIDSDEKIEGKLTFSYIQEQYAEKSNRLIRVNLTYSDKDLLETDTRLGSYELRVTLVWAPGGTEKNVSFQDPSSPTNKVTKLKEWMQAEHIPDVIVIGFGSWLLLMREGDDELSPFPELSRLGHSLVSTLKYLATRTRVLFLSQSRTRRKDGTQIRGREGWSEWFQCLRPREIHQHPGTDGLTSRTGSRSQR